jgi:Ala-tRNA(Pro) deacylase
MSISIRLKNFLDEKQIPYSVLTHTSAYTAQGAAATMQISGKELAKTVVLWTGEETILAVLPAPNHVRLDKLAAELGRSVRLATEQEFSSLFPDCELGAMPPLGSLYNLPVYVDESLAADQSIVFNAGDAPRRDSHSVRRLCSPGEAQGLLVRPERVTQTRQEVSGGLHHC